jgi:hypothetical protein
LKSNAFQLIQEIKRFTTAHGYIVLTILWFVAEITPAINDLLW